MSAAALPPARSVLVTGASGLIGSKVVAHLGADPGPIETIVAMDLHEVPAGRQRAGIDYVTGDIRDSQMTDLLADHAVDTVVHLAAIVTAGKDSTREHEYSVDVLGTRNVLGAAVANRVTQLVYTSSGAAYGYHADNPVPLHEDDPLRGNPEFAYSDHKRLVEEMLERHRHDHPELAQLVFRPGTILGETVDNPITAIFDRPVVLGVQGSDAPFVLVWDEDVARCIVEGIRRRRTGTYNLAGDGVVTLRQIARRIGKPYVAVPVPVLRGALRILKTLRLSRVGPEQISFLQYRPVLANDRLKDQFEGAPTATSEECFERYRRHRFSR